MKTTIKNILSAGASVIKICTAIFLTGILLIQCIDPFDPGISEDPDLVAVDGSLIKGRAKQTITISRSSPLETLEYHPISGCNVKITDDTGNEFFFTEEKEGTYTAEIEEQFIQFNHQYKLVFSTPDGNLYESNWETLIKSAPVDSLYYIKEDHYSEGKDMLTEGVQFYVDLKAPDEGARYYRWELVETYEHHSAHLISGYYDGEDTISFFPYTQDSLYKCWSTKEVNELYSENTLNLIRNEKKRIPFNYISVGSVKISVRYSLLARQYALNEDAYNYWNRKKVESKESGGLYTQQPSQSQSNIKNINDPDETVLGFFWASSVEEKRVFCDESFYYHNSFCELDTFDFEIHGEGPYPVFYIGGGMYPMMTAAKECFDCSFHGASLEKPDFW